MVKAKSYDFNGPVIGPLAIVIGLPLVCYLLVYCSNELVRFLVAGSREQQKTNCQQLQLWDLIIPSKGSKPYLSDHKL
jgi:hypothetical protein